MTEALLDPQMPLVDRHPDGRDLDVGVGEHVDHTGSGFRPALPRRPTRDFMSSAVNRNVQACPEGRDWQTDDPRRWAARSSVSLRRFSSRPYLSWNHAPVHVTDARSASELRPVAPRNRRYSEFPTSVRVHDDVASSNVHVRTPPNSRVSAPRRNSLLGAPIRPPLAADMPREPVAPP